jgi:hypothetical protein
VTGEIEIVKSKQEAQTAKPPSDLRSSHKQAEYMVSSRIYSCILTH